MSAKTSPARRAAFMAVVAETGNQTLACERAKVSRSWVTLHRSTDPAFRAELEAAVAVARVRLSGLRAAGGSMAPGRGWGSQGGEELVARGGNGGGTQIARARLKQWTPRVEARFLDVLAGCCNVKAACAAVGLSQASAYNHRERWPAFAERWDAAVVLGYGRVESASFEAAGAMFESLRDGREPTPEPALSGMTVDAAMQLLWLHEKQVRGTGGAPGARRGPPDMAAVETGLERRIAAIVRHRTLTEADVAADRRSVADGAAAVARLGAVKGQ